MAELGAISVQLKADAGQFTAGMQQATAATRTFYQGAEQAGEYAVGAERGIRRMEFALGGISAEALGANHTLGMLGEGLLLFGGGEPIVLGVLGGIAAIAGAWKMWNLASDEATATNTKIAKSFEDVVGATGKTEQAIISLAGSIDTLQTHIAVLRGPEEGKSIWEDIKELFGAPTDVQEIYDQMNLATARTGRLLEQIRRRGEVEKIQARIGRGRSTRATTGPMTFEQLSNQLNFQDFMANPETPTTSTTTGPMSFGQLSDRLNFQDFMGDVSRPARAIADPFSKTLGDEMFKVGESVSKRLADGLISGNVNMAKLGQQIAQELMGGLIDSVFQIAKTNFIQSLTREAATAAGAAGFLFP